MLTSWRRAGALLALGAALVAGPRTAGAGPAGYPAPYRAWAVDSVLDHMIDGRIHVFDPVDGTKLGQLPSGLAASIAFSPDDSALYVATTYFDRGTRGRRADVIEIWDTDGLGQLGEIPIGEDRAIAPTTQDMLAIGGDGRLALVQNDGERHSLTVVDLGTRRVLGRIDNDGCWTVVASATVARRFATTCGDGTVEAIELDERGGVVSRRRTPPFFDPRADPLIFASERIGDVRYWATAQGRIVAVDLAAAEPKLLEPWDVARAAKGGWRPAGWDPLAAQAQGGRLYLAMRSGMETGDPGRPAEEIWALDVESRKLLLRAAGHDAVSLAVGPGKHPILYALAEGKAIVALEPARKLEVVGRIEEVAETGTFLTMR